MIRVEIKPRQDDLYDIWVIAANGEVLLNSVQGYENAADAEAIARKVFGTRMVANAAGTGEEPRSEPVAMRIEYRNGKTHTERLR